MSSSPLMEGKKKEEPPAYDDDVDGADWSVLGFGELMVHVALFILSGPTLILLQKYVLGILNFEYPIFIVTLAAVSRWILVLLLVHTGTIKLGAHKDLTFMEWTRGMLPVGILECVSLAAFVAVFVLVLGGPGLVLAGIYVLWFLWLRAATG